MVLLYNQRRGCSYRAGLNVQTMIDNKKLFDLFNKHGIRPTDIRANKIISESTLQRLRNGNVTINADALNHLCALFNCQPSDLMTYVPDKESERWAKKMWEKLEGR